MGHGLYRYVATFILCSFFCACAPTTKLIPNTDKVQAQRHYEYGLNLLQTGRPRAAYKEFLRANKLEPNNHLPYLGLGRALIKQNKYASALLVLQDGIQLNTNTPAFFYHLGAVNTHLELWPAAIKYSIFALEFENFKHRSEALYNLGLGYKGVGSWEQARYTFEAALLEKPDLVKARWQLIATLEHLNEWAEAIRNSRKLLQIGKNNSLKLNNIFLSQVNKHIAMAYTKLGKPGIGQAFMEKSRQLALGSKLNTEK